MPGKEATMEIHCTSCRKAWSVHYLWHKAVFETALTTEQADAWQCLSRPEKLGEYYRRQFRAAGWEFGNSIVNIVRCPSCSEN